jgi:hypothetical protein
MEANWIGNILRRYGLLKDVIEGRVEGRRKLRKDKE